MSFPFNTITQSVAVTTAAYSANQVMGSGVKFFNSAPTGSFIQSVIINTNSSNASQIDFLTFLSSMPNTTFTDHTTIAISSADFASQGPVVNVGTWNYSGTAASNGTASGLAYATWSSLQTMYWTLVARGPVTVNSSNGVSVTVTFVS